eukprot:gene22969-biopygen20788
MRPFLSKSSRAGDAPAVAPPLFGRNDSGRGPGRAASPPPPPWYPALARSAQGLPEGPGNPLPWGHRIDAGAGVARAWRGRGPGLSCDPCGESAVALPREGACTVRVCARHAPGGDGGGAGQRSAFSCGDGGWGGVIGVGEGVRRALVNRACPREQGVPSCSGGSRHPTPFFSRRPGAGKRCGEVAGGKVAAAYAAIRPPPRPPPRGRAGV